MAQLSRWRNVARQTIQGVISQTRQTAKDKQQIIKAIDAAYPFGLRENHPYKAWLTERKIALRELDFAFADSQNSDSSFLLSKASSLCACSSDTGELCLFCLGVEK